MENVLCFSRFLLEDIYGYFDGISFDNKYLHLITTEENYIFVSRKQAERDPHYKQVIPYCIFVDEDGLIFNYERGQKGGEGRLRGRSSIGVGGHINDEDFSTSINLSQSKYNSALYREVAEEFGLNLYSGIESDLKNTCMQSQPTAFINEELTEVGKVHFGVVHVLPIKQSDIISLEADIVINGSFNSYEDLMKDIEIFENWSQICLKDWQSLIGES